MSKLTTDVLLKESIKSILTELVNSTYDWQEYTDSEISDILEISDEQALELSKIINDNVKANNKLWSSNKIDSELQNMIIEANKYSDELIGQISSISLEYVTVLPDTDIKSNVIYILQGIPNTLNVYNNSTSAFVTVGDLNIDLTNYYTKSEVDAELAKKANADEVLKPDAIVSDLTTTSGSTTLSTAGLQTELDKKANDSDVVKKTDIVTTIDSTSTDGKIPTSLAVRNAILGKSVTNNATYGGDVLYFPCGIYKIVNNTVAESLTNLPIAAAGILQILSISSHNNDLSTYTYVYRTYIFIPIGKRDIYIRNISTGSIANVFTVDTGWKKVCTTSVADVAETRITFSDNTNYEEKATSIYSNYEVADGICYVLIYAKCLAPTNSWISINDSLPRPKRFVFKSLNALANATDNLNCTINLGGNMSLRGGTANGEYITTFSYHVAG